MVKIQRFIDCHVPVNLCNFKCDYCTVGQWKAFKDNYSVFERPVEKMAAALSPERMGGICAINLCGNGETLLHPQILDFIELLLKDGHYVSIVTNGVVTKAIDFLCGLDEEQRSRIFIKFSFHYTELLRLNLMTAYFSNIKKAHESGMSLTVELVASDSNAPHIEEIKELCMKNLGVLCHLTDPRANTEPSIPRLTQMPLNEHVELWSQFDSPLFDYRQATWGKSRADNFCYGGVWSFCLSLFTGQLKQCNRNADTVQEIFDNIEEPIRFLPRGHSCSLPHCFNSHVFDCLCGAVPEIESPLYSELRNRVLPDGSEWLKPAYKEIYSRKISDNNKKYSPELQTFSDGIMRLRHGNKKVSSKFIEIIKNYLSNFQSKSVSVYGDNGIADWLLQNFEFLKNYKKNEKTDFIIVTDYSKFASIKAALSIETNADVISIVDLPSSAAIAGD